VSAVNELMVREYFESLGYFVSQPRKYVGRARSKRGEEGADMIVLNPRVTEHRIPECMVWGTAELGTVARAVVGVRGWHTERFYVSNILQNPWAFRFVEPDLVKHAARVMGSADMARILCIPRLPASGELKDRTIRMLKEKGIDGVISFETILNELIAYVQPNRNYEKSDLLQILRILKIYDLLKDRQLDMFSGPLRKKRRVRAPVDRASSDISDKDEQPAQ